MTDVVKIVNNGLAILTNRLIGSGTEPKFIGWGVGTGTAAVTDSALGSEGAETSTSKVTGTSSRVTTTAANDTHQVTGTVTCVGSAKAITEVGLFDAASAGTMFVRASFSAINVSVGDSITFTVKSVFSCGS